jgi:peptide deformylase
MAILTILQFPHPRLRTRAKEIKSITPEIHRLATDMLETMYDAPGIGLAATQVDVHKRLLVIDISAEKNQPMVFINPEFEVINDTDNQSYDEGCLSVPGFYEPVIRPNHIRATALGLDGKAFTAEYRDLMAICLQHEIDHLNGKLFVDHISTLKRNSIRTKLLKEQKREAQESL